MSLNDTRITLFNYFKDNWTDSAIMFDGQKTGDKNLKRINPWLFTGVIWNNKGQRGHSAANAVYSNLLGILIVKLYVRQNSGVGELDSMTDSVNDLFYARKIDNIIISEINVLSTEPFQKWNVRHIHIPFIVQVFDNIT